MGNAKRVSLFKVLRRELGQQLVANGFGEVPQDASSRSHTLLYFRQESHLGRFGFWFQRHHKSLCVDALGSSFTLEFFRSLEDPFKAGGGRERFYFLLTPAEREEMRAIQNNVINRLPPLEGFLAPWEMESFGWIAEKERQVIEKQFNPLHEVWMRYRDEADILTWTAFIGRLLPALGERYQRLSV